MRTAGDLVSSTCNRYVHGHDSLFDVKVAGVIHTDPSYNIQTFSYSDSIDDYTVRHCFIR